MPHVDKDFMKEEKENEYSSINWSCSICHSGILNMHCCLPWRCLGYSHAL